MTSRLNPTIRQRIEKATGADSNMCWTCSSCDSECPIEIATNRLRPQRIVRFANLGLFEDLLISPEIWYCLSCRRCNSVCPNLVKPETLVRYARIAAVRCGVVSYDSACAYYDLFRRFQRVRWHAVYDCLHGNSEPITDVRWRSWLDAPIPDSRALIASTRLFKASPPFRHAAEETDISSCFTCGECSSACPVAGERGAFDPRFIFRLVNLGLADELLLSPSIWLCIQCGRCTDACSQRVDGCRMIASLREFAVKEGKVDADFPLKVKHAQKQVFERWLDDVNRLLGIREGRGGLPSFRMPMAECV